MTAERWNCPYYQVRLDMGWVAWVLTAYTSRHLPAPCSAAARRSGFGTLPQRNWMGSSGVRAQIAAFSIQTISADGAAVVHLAKPGIWHSVLRKRDPAPSGGSLTASRSTPGAGSGRSPRSGFLRSTVGAVVRSRRNIAMRLTSTVVVDDPASALVEQTALLGRRRKLYFLTIQRSFVR